MKLAKNTPSRKIVRKGLVRETVVVLREYKEKNHDTFGLIYHQRKRDEVSGVDFGAGGCGEQNQESDRFFIVNRGYSTVNDQQLIAQP